MKSKTNLIIRFVLIFIIIWVSLVLNPFMSYQKLTFMEGKITNSRELFFNENRTYELIKKQVDIGPRYPGSEGIEKTRQLISSELGLGHKWDIFFQNFSKEWMNNENITCVNIICEPFDRDISQQSFLLLAHYDSRLWASEDPESQKRKNPVPGANDGASGVALVLELGRIFFEVYNYANLQMIFFDAEDQGDIYGWDWLVGSRYYAKSQKFSLNEFSFGILFDMVGGENATFKREKYSDQYAGKLVTWIWDEAKTLGFDDYFINSSGRRVIDDHVPLLEQGLPVVDIIDEFGTRYKPWHTTYDNMTYIDKKTLRSVGLTLESIISKLINSTELLSSLSSFEFISPFSLYFSLNLFLLSTVKRIRCKKK